MKHLNVRELNQAAQKKQLKRKQSFERVLQLCYSRIRGFADKEHEFCLYEVPEFVIGHPVYNIQECVTFVIDALSRNGFVIEYYFPRVLYISWGSKDKQGKAKNAPKTFKKSIEYKANSEFIDSVKEFRPSGKFVLNLA
jgi:hypothetical protein